MTQNPKVLRYTYWLIRYLNDLFLVRCIKIADPFNPIKLHYMKQNILKSCEERHNVIYSIMISSVIHSKLDYMSLSCVWTLLCFIYIIDVTSILMRMLWSLLPENTNYILFISHFLQTWTGYPYLWEDVRLQLVRFYYCNGLSKTCLKMLWENNLSGW